MAMTPGILRKTITKNIGGVSSVGKFIYKIGVTTGHVQFYHKTEMLKKVLGQEMFSHQVDFTETEKQHLLAGGTIVVVHGCGAEFHIRVPKVM